jgi:inward rectifier potassium channel
MNGNGEQQVPYDPGLSQKYTGEIRRIINRDGSFNVHRRGVSFWNKDIYHYLINAPWPKFFGIMIAGYFAINFLFATVYFMVGAETLHGANTSTPLREYLSAFFFSAQTFTTVGYGGIDPEGLGANVVASIEAAIGLLGFAMAAALFYGRFSRPNSRLVFSRHAVIAPYEGMTSLQFRVVNERPNLMMELEARVLLMTVESTDGDLKRVYRGLDLERANIQFLPLTWTVVHPVTETSPLFGKTQQELAELQAEILILIKGYDDTFNQYVHARCSYRHEDILWGARFRPAFRVDPEGGMVVEIDRVHDVEPIALAE